MGVSLRHAVAIDGGQCTKSASWGVLHWSVGKVLLISTVTILMLLTAYPASTYAAATTVSGSLVRSITTASGPSDALNNPSSVAVSGDSLYVVDTGKNRIVQYSLSTGAYVRQWGSGGTGNSSAAGPAFSSPRGIAISHNGRVTVADTGNHRIMQYSLTGAYQSRWGSLGSGQGQFRSPLAVAQSPISNLTYVLDSGNGRIQYFNPGGGYRGEFGTLGSGPAQLSATASGMSIGPDGRVVVADTGNHRIQAYTAEGVHLRSTGTFGSALGQLNQPRDARVGVAGLAVVVETGNHRIQAFDVATADARAIGVFGTLGQGDLQFSSPTGALYTDDHLLIVADSGNNRIQFIQLAYGTDDGGGYDPVAIGFDGLSCTDCHLADLREEHNLKTEHGCLSCHAVEGRSGQVRYDRLGKLLAEEGLETLGTCGSDSVYCHAVGTGQPFHGQDGARIQSSHWTRNASWERATTTYCGGSSGGCHSYGSTESPFWFGSMDIASAHADYWYHQSRGSVAGALAVGSNPSDAGTVDITQFANGCGLCHQPDFKRSFGKEQKDAARQEGRQFGCPSCHTPRAVGSGGYGSYSSNPTCYRTKHWASLDEFTQSAGSRSTAELTVSGSSSGDGIIALASAYIQNLIAGTTGSSPENTSDVDLDAVHAGFSGAEPSATSLSVHDLPSYAVPASKPAPLGAVLSAP